MPANVNPDMLVAANGGSGGINWLGQIADLANSVAGVWRAVDGQPEPEQYYSPALPGRGINMSPSARGVPFQGPVQSSAFSQIHPGILVLGGVGIVAALIVALK